MNKLDRHQLVAKCKELFLDPTGPRETLLDRIRQYNSLNNISTAGKKRRKKNKTRIVLQDEKEDGPKIEIEVVPIVEKSAEFNEIMEKFNQRSQRKGLETQVSNQVDQQNSSSDEDYETRVASKKKQKKMNRMSVAVLKTLVSRPEVVEWTDVTASDPIFLVNLKCYQNTIPVPSHWSQRRKFLADYIKATGIMELRNTSGHGNRNRYAAKMGKLDIDYQKLHDAFFKNQTKPYVTMHGEIYYEGKEFEAKMKNRKPGSLSEDLVIALNIPPLAPPPWLLNMQRFGPPPSYPQLKIPGLNCPIPKGAQWGYHPGGWGKPPVDEYNRPLYGDVFGLYNKPPPSDLATPIERERWGELEVVEEEEEESEEEEEEEDVLEDKESISGFETPSSIASSTATKVPEIIEIKSRSDSSKSLYTVLPQKETSAKGFMGSTHAYELPKDRPNASDIDVDDLANDLSDRKRRESSRKQKEFKF